MTMLPDRAKICHKQNYVSHVTKLPDGQVTLSP
jgi:hypothetical protein